MITYFDDKGRVDGYCTGTAVGPHALLTALHCDEGESDTISLDLSVRKYHINGHLYDGRDHIIYHLDGPEFKNIVTIKERPAKLGEEVVSYGNGHRDYPSHTYVGRVVVDDNGGDISDIDAADQVACFSLPVVSGDSGSAVYGKDGSLVALVTYGNDVHAVGFALNFSKDELAMIAQPDEGAAALPPDAQALQDLLNSLIKQ